MLKRTKMLLHFRNFLWIPNVFVLGYAKDHHQAFNSQQPKLIKLMNYNFLTLSHCIHIHVSSWNSVGKYEFLFRLSSEMTLAKFTCLTYGSITSSLSMY